MRSFTRLRILANPLASVASYLSSRRAQPRLEARVLGLPRPGNRRISKPAQRLLLRLETKVLNRSFTRIVHGYDKRGGGKGLGISDRSFRTQLAGL